MRMSLRWKYAAHLAGLVSALLLASGIVGGWFTLRESLSAVEAVQRERARAAAGEIAGYIGRAQAALRRAVTKFDGDAPLEELRLEGAALLRHHPQVIALRWLDRVDRERLVQSRFGLDGAGTLGEAPAAALVAAARRDGQAVGAVRFVKASEPYLTVAAAAPVGGNVLLADLNLTHVWDLVAPRGRASPDVTYVIDDEARLIAHSQIARVLARADAAALPQVQRALAARAAAPPGLDARDFDGGRVVSTAERIAGLSWTVFVEQPLALALQPVVQSLLRSVTLVALGIAAALAASVVLARRMVRPIRELGEYAERVGLDGFAPPIELRSGDELEALAAQFNRMAQRLQQTIARQEQLIAERTLELAKANEAKSRFLAAASHDLRQPMHALSLFVGQLRGVRRHRHDAAVVARIEQSVQALTTLLEALLDLSKLDVGAVMPLVRDFAVEPLLARLVQQFEPIAHAKGLTLHHARSSAWVRSDPVLLERILINLLANAVRYTRRGGVLIGCRRRRNGIEVMVGDTGIGIEPQQLSRVFEEFYRVSADAAAGPEGLGLGLAIVDRLARLLGHPISIRSTPGRGTVVGVLVARAQPGPIATPAITGPVDTLRGRRVLVIDDDAAVRDATRGLLERWGCEVDTAAGGDEALACARAKPPHGVLCDLELAGGESGLAVVGRLRREHGVALRCAFVTGSTAAELAAAARASGDALVFKPLTPARLRALVDHLLQAPDPAATYAG